MSPVRIVAERDHRSRAREFAEAVEAGGLTVSVPRFARARPGDWLFPERGSIPDGDPEAVLVGSEHDRSALESGRPELVGRVWVLADGGEAALAGLLAERLRPSVRVEPTSVGVTGYNQKFIKPISQHLARIPHVRVLTDEWSKYAVQDRVRTEQVLAGSDVVVAEWCGPNAVFASHHKRPDQRLVVRLHRFELERDDWRQVDIDAVDQLITVGPYYRDLVLETTGWPESKVVIIPNGVDLAQFDRPKTDDAARTVGLLGAIPWRKRPDRALDIVEAAGPEWRLSIKSAAPESEPWTWKDDAYRARFERLLARVATSPQTRWEPASALVADWFRGIGTILSVSEDESFHLAPAEGMASGTIPVVWDWPGADRIYAPHRIVHDVEEAARTVLDPPHRDAVRAEVSPFDLRTILGTWERAVFAGRSPG
jgi:glycosyltransferase involved in cell wall biosynthesis